MVVSAHVSNDRGPSPQKFKERKAKGRKENIQFKTYQFPLGKKDRVKPRDLFQALNKEKSLRGIEVGDINIGASETRFQADSSFHKKLVQMGFNEV